jgi:lipopolysaccharide export system protein LptA
MWNHKQLSLFVCTCILATQYALALPEDRNKPIHISANSAQIDENSGITTYSGNVLISQGTMKIKAGKVNLYQRNNNVNRIVATGSPASFSQTASANQAITDAYGQRLEYQVDTQTITITGNARVEQDKNQFSGERIVYQMDKSLVNAYSGEGNSGQRVQMIIQPKAK